MMTKRGVVLFGGGGGLCFTGRKTKAKKGQVPCTKQIQHLERNLSCGNNSLKIQKKELRNNYMNMGYNGI